MEFLSSFRLHDVFKAPYVSGGIFIMHKVMRIFKDYKSLPNQNDDGWGEKLSLINMIVGDQTDKGFIVKGGSFT